MSSSGLAAHTNSNNRIAPGADSSLDSDSESQNASTFAMEDEAPPEDKARIDQRSVKNMLSMLRSKLRRQTASTAEVCTLPPA